MKKSIIQYCNNKLKLWVVFGLGCPILACQKFSTAPPSSGVAALTVVNAIPNTSLVIPVINTSSPIAWFASSNYIFYGSFYEYSPIAGSDTVYVDQYSDTLASGPKGVGEMFYGILNLKKGGIYSLYLCGMDTTSPDYLFTTDTLPYHGPTDSVVGIRFVNLSAGSNAISINLEGSPYGSEVSSLSYKGITQFKSYTCNSAMTDSGYLFVVRDMATGDSLTYFNISGFGSFGGVGLADPSSGNALVFRNATIAIYGLENNANVPLGAFLIDDY
jgi:hypothetical protein